MLDLSIQSLDFVLRERHDVVSLSWNKIVDATSGRLGSALAPRKLIKGWYTTVLIRCFAVSIRHMVQDFVQSTSNKGHSYMNACGVLDHVVLRSSRPSACFDNYSAAQSISVGRTDDSVPSIRGPERNQSQR